VIFPTQSGRAAVRSQFCLASKAAGLRYPRGAVSSFAIVPRFDPFEDGILRFLFCGERPLKHQLIFQAGPGAFDDRVVPAVADPAHAAPERELGEFILVLSPGVMSAAHFRFLPVAVKSRSSRLSKTG